MMGYIRLSQRDAETRNQPDIARFWQRGPLCYIRGIVGIRYRGNGTRRFAISSIRCYNSVDNDSGVPEVRVAPFWSQYPDYNNQYLWRNQTGDVSKTGRASRLISCYGNQSPASGGGGAGAVLQEGKRDVNACTRIISYTQVHAKLPQQQQQQQIFFRLVSVFANDKSNNNSS